MKPINPPFPVTIILAILSCLALGSCASDPETPAAVNEMSVSFRVETRSVSRAEGDADTGYEDASKWENYIDIAAGDYRIGFFDESNLCITPFVPTEIDADDKGTYIDYTLKGDVPPILTFYTHFKIVVLANWGTYPEMTMGVTTIDDLCHPDTSSDPDSRLAQFKHFEMSEDTPNRYVPMFGVKDYTNVQFGVDEDNNPVVSYTGGPVNMLRAIAKVEVIFDVTEGYELQEGQSLTIENYNDYGFCAPKGVDEESDYYHNAWASDYWKGNLHLVGDANDSGTKSLSMKAMTDADGKTVWVAYLPEYRNVGDDNKGRTDKARIAIPVKKDGKSYTSYIEFATYSEGEPGDPINIERNNLYRFTITKVDPGVKWKVVAVPWNGLEHPAIVM